MEPEQVLGQDDVEPRRVRDERHRARVDVHVLDGDVRIVLRHIIHDRAPQLRRLQHVGLVDGGQVLPSLARGVEGHARDPIDLANRVPHRIECLAGLSIDLARLAEVEPAGQLPHDQQIRTARDLGLERAGLLEPRPDARRPQVGEYAEAFANGEQPAFGALLRRQVIERRIADRAKQRCRHRPARRECLRRERGLAGAKRRPTHQLRGGLDGVAEAAGDRVQHVAGRGNDFRANPVTGNQSDIEFHPRGAGDVLGRWVTLGDVGPLSGVRGAAPKLPERYPNLSKRVVSNAVSVADFLGARALAMHAGSGGGGLGLRAEVGDDLRQLGVGDGLLLIGEGDHPPVEAIQLEA